jgi:hypothetical protein
MVSVANPALPAARAYETSLMLEVARKYAVDWIHLDYARFPCEPMEPYFSFDQETLRLFKQDTGIDMSAIKARDSGNMAWNAWPAEHERRPFRARPDAPAARPVARISAAVFLTPNARAHRSTAVWARGPVDMSPDATATMRGCSRNSSGRRLQRKGRSQVCAGIGIDSYNQNTVEGMMEMGSADPAALMAVFSRRAARGRSRGS